MWLQGPSYWTNAMDRPPSGHCWVGQSQSLVSVSSAEESWAVMTVPGTVALNLSRSVPDADLGKLLLVGCVRSRTSGSDLKLPWATGWQGCLNSGISFIQLQRAAASHGLWEGLPPSEYSRRDQAYKTTVWHGPAFSAHIPMRDIAMIKRESRYALYWGICCSSASRWITGSRRA